MNDYAAGKFTVSVENPSGPLPMPNNRLSDWCPTMTVGKTYYLSGNADTTANEDINLSGVSENWSFGTTRQITEEDLQSTVQFGVGTYSNIMIVEGTTEKPYEVYTGGEAATEPTPEFPLPITSAGNYDAEEEKYEVGIGVTGKNLFDASKIPTSSRGGATVTNNGDGSFTISGNGTVTPTYNNRKDLDYDESKCMLKQGTLKAEFQSISGPYFEIQIRNDKKVYGSTANRVDKNGSIEITKSMLEDPRLYISYVFYLLVGSTIVPGTIKPVLYQEGDSTWEPFKQQLSTLQLPNPLRGIPVDSGGNYTDADGQQWICDYIDRERGKYVQCVQEVVFDGSDDEYWRLWENESNETERFYCNLNIAASIKVMNNMASICDLLIYHNSDNDYPHYRWSVTDGVVNQFVVFINKESAENVGELKSWLKSNNITLCYLLETPIETDLTQEQLTALDLSTYQGITNIGTDTMPQVGVEVEYIADTKTYIDNAIAEAIAAIPTE